MDGLPRCNVIQGNARCCILCLRDLGEEVLVLVGDLPEHNKKKHMGCKHACPTCKLVFETHYQLRSHQHTKEDNCNEGNVSDYLPRTRVFRKGKRSCILCLEKNGHEKLVPVDQMGTHNRTTHPGCRYICKACNLAFETPQHSWQHIAIARYNGGVENHCCLV